MFVTFEGLDGSGKTTQVDLLRAHLVEQGRDVVTAREPGGTWLGERVRELVLHGDDVAPWAEAALFAAARAELVSRVIRPALDAGSDVICDRYVDSSLAYQGIARGLGVEAVLDLNAPAIDRLLPHRTFVLLVDPVESERRREGAPDRIEAEDDAFRVALDLAYRRLAELFPERVVGLDGSLAPEEIAEQVREGVRDLP